MTATSGFKLEEVLARLPNESFLSLRDDFGDGVPCDTFVAVLLAECSKNDRELRNRAQRDEFSSALRQLFAIIDVNNNGDVSWDEFSHYIMYAVQAPEVSETKEIIQTYAFDYLGRCPVESTRLRSAVVDYSTMWGKYILLECGATSSRLALFTKQTRPGQETPYREYAEYKTTTLLESICFVDSVKALATTTTNGKLQFFSYTEDPVLEEAGKMQRLRKFREHHLEGRQTVMRFDPETNCLFCGNRDGVVTVISPQDDTRVQPDILQQVRLHKQPISDLCVLPERGNKKLLSSALDGKIQMYDIVREDFYGELGNAVAAHSMAFNEEYSVLVTCSHKDLDPLVWAPHAVTNVFVGRLESTRAASRARPMVALCPRGTPYCFTGDLEGQIKLWDLRKLKQVVSFYADGDLTKGEMSAQLTLRSLAADPQTLDVMSFCRSVEYGNGLEFCKSKLVPSRDAVSSHDSPVVAFCTTKPSVGWFLTASDDCVKIWDVATGEVAYHFKNILPSVERTTCMCCDAEGSRIYMGTLLGNVCAISTATCGLLGESVRHNSAIIAIQLHNGALFSLSQDGALNVADIRGDSPKLMYSCRRAVDGRALVMDVSSNFAMMAVGFEGGLIELNDNAEHSHGASIGVIRPPPLNAAPATGVDDVTSYMLPAAAEITAAKFCGCRALLCYGDTRGRLHAVATRPHPMSHTRFCLWKTFFPKATSTLFAVPLSMEWKESNTTLIVGDDQGNVTLWDFSEVVEHYCFVPCAFPMSVKQILSLPKPTESPLVFAPKLRGYYNVCSSLSPVRQLTLLNREVFAFVDERTVCFASVHGDNCGSLLQGRGTQLKHLCEPFTLRVDDDSGTASQFEASLASAPSVTEDIGASVKKLSLSLTKSSSGSDSAPFVAMTQAGYQAMVAELKAQRSTTSVARKLTLQDEALFQVDTPPPSPAPHTEVRARVHTQYPQAVKPILAIGGAVTQSATAGSYFVPLTGPPVGTGVALPATATVSSSASPGTTLNQSLTLSMRPPDVCDDSTAAERTLQAAKDRLVAALSEISLSAGEFAVSTRPRPAPLNPPTMAAVFSADQSYSTDWKAKLLQNHSSGSRKIQEWIYVAVAQFDVHVSVAPRQMLAVTQLPVPPLAAHPGSKPSSAFSGFVSRRRSGVEHSRASFRKQAAEKAKGCLLSNPQPEEHAPLVSPPGQPPRAGTGSRTPNEDTSRHPDGLSALSLFKLPESSLLRDAAHQEALRSVSQKIEREAARRAAWHSLSQQVVSPSDGQEAALQALRHRPRGVAPADEAAAVSSQIALQRRPQTPQLGFAQSTTLHRLFAGSTWKSSTGPLQANKLPLSRPSSSTAIERGGPRSHSAPLSQEGAAGKADGRSRQDYVQFLLHLPRMKEILKVQQERGE